MADRDDTSQDFTVRLDNFEGPFDLLLQLITRRKMDVTEVALSQVTDDFIAHVRAGGSQWDLEVTSSFLVVAATLLDLKAARLLPRGEVEDPEDLALLEARDLLFARLLQYRAFKEVSYWQANKMMAAAHRFARPGGLEDHFVALLPEVQLPSAQFLADLAAEAFTPRELPAVPVEHLHLPQVSVQEQAMLLVRRLREATAVSFRELTADADRMTTVARFLAVLELYKERAIAVEQLEPLGELVLRWLGDADEDLEVSDEFDRVEDGNDS